MVTSAPLRILHLVLAYCLVSAPRAVCAQSSHATFLSGYPRVEYRNGTNTFKLFVALDRAGVAYFVAVPRVDQISNTTIPTPDEIFAGSASVNAGEIAAAAGSLAFTDPNTERTMIVRDLPDESTFDVYFATHTGKPDVSGTGVASPASEMILLTKVLEIGDVTPPLFVMGTPHAEGHGPKSLSVSVAASEHHSAYHVVILPSGASPPRTAVEVYTGVLAENAANSEIVFKDSGSVPFFNITSLTFFGDMSPGVAYTIYMTLADKHGNVNPVVQTVQMFTKYCMSCPALMVLAGGSACECVVPAIFTLRVRTTGSELVKNRDALKASVAEQLNVAASQVAMLSWERSLNYPGYMMVTMSVTPLSASDVATTTTVDSALASGNLTIGGAPSGVSDLVLSGEPDTRILLGSKNRPKGRTNPMTDDGSIPGQLMEGPERTNKAMFQWKVWFGDTECTECISQCKLDIGIWAMCTSPKVYFALPRGEHNFFVRGLGGDGVPDSTPARYTWTIRYRPEIFFNTAEVPPASVNRSDLTFSLSSNKPEAQFEYSFNSLDIFPTYETLPLGVTTVKVNGSVGENIFAARAVAEGEISATVARHTWVYDIFAPYANVTTSAVKNGSMVNKLTDIRFVVFGNDTDPTVLPSAGIEEIWVRFMRANDSATFPPPLFDWRLADNFKEVQAEFSLDSNISDLSDGLYVLSARAVDKAGNSQYTTDPHGYDHYYFELSEKVPGTPIISPATTLEDIMTSVNNTDTGKRQLHITSTIPSVDAYAYLFTDIINGQLFWSDGVTEIFDGDYVLADNVSYGLRFLPSKDLNNETVLLDGANPEFSFTVRSAGSFDDRALVDTPVTVHITVLSANDPPVLDPDEDYHLTGLYIYDAVSTVTNWGDSVFEIVNKGFSDIDEPYKATSANMGMVILSADDTQGDWQWSDSSGRNWHHFPKDLSPARPLLVRAGLEDRVRYFPRVESGMPLDNVAWTASITFRAWDGVSGHGTGSRGQWFTSNGYPANTTHYPAAGYIGTYSTSASIPSPSGQFSLPLNNQSLPSMSNMTPISEMFIYYDATSFDAGGSHSMTIASAYIEIYGIEYTTYARANLRDTKLERLRQELSLQPFCPPEHGSALRLPVYDGNASVLMRVDTDAGQFVTSPPWTVEAWVRRDAVTNEQTLFSDPMSGGAIMIGLAPGTGIAGVMLPHQEKARKRARQNFNSAANNTAANIAAANIAAVEASCARWNYSLPINKWTHLAFVAVPEGEPYRSPHSFIRLYVDGLHIDTIGPDVGMPMPLGVIGSPGRAAFTIDEVKYWSFARSPTDLFREKGLLKVGDESGLVSYLMFEEGCGNTTHDQSVGALVQGRHLWDINLINATWERRSSGMLHCGEIFAVSPNHIPPSGRIMVTIYGSGFKNPESDQDPHKKNPKLPTRHRVGKKPVCRFRFHGTGGNLRIVPATVVSPELLTCPVVTWSNLSLMRGYISVEYCDIGMSCCSLPVTLDVPRQNLYPENYKAPHMNDQRVNTAQMLYRNAKATSARPFNFEMNMGTMITIKGRGFTTPNEGSTLGSLHDDGMFCNFTTSLLDAATSPFFANASGAAKTEQKTYYIPMSNEFSRLGSDYVVRAKHSGVSSHFNNSKKRDDANRSVRWFAVPAYVVSSAEAICETPVITSLSTPTGYVTEIHVSLVFNSGASHVDVEPQLGLPIRAAFPGDLRVTRLAADHDSDGVLVATRDGGTVVSIFTALTDPAAYPSCQFGTVKVLGRYTDSYLVECIIPVASGHCPPHLVEFRFTMFADGSRHDPVYSRIGGPAVTISRPKHANLMVFATQIPTSGTGWLGMSPLRDATDEEELHTSVLSCNPDFIEAVCAHDEFIDWSAWVSRTSAPLCASSVSYSLVHCRSSSMFFAVGFFAVALNVAPNADNRMDIGKAQPIVVFRTDPAVHTLGADSGSTDGGWIVAIIGEGFLPGDGCVLISQRRGTCSDQIAGYFISSTLIRCEASEVTTSRQVQPSTTSYIDSAIRDLDSVVFDVDEQPFHDQTVGVYLGVPGGWDGQTLVRGGSGGAIAFLFRPLSVLDVIRPAHLPASGGLALYLTGHNSFTGFHRFKRGRCRIGSFDMVTRPVNLKATLHQVTMQCVTPALVPTQMARNSGLRARVAPAYPSGLIGSNTTLHPILFAPIVAGIVGIPIGSPAPQKGAPGATLEIFTSLTSLRRKSSPLDALGFMHNIACAVPARDRSAIVNKSGSTRTLLQRTHAVSALYKHGTASSFSRCSLPITHMNINAGFYSIFVGLISDEHATVYLSVEFEYASSPELLSLITHRNIIPTNIVEVSMRGGRGLHVASGAWTLSRNAALQTSRVGVRDEVLDDDDDDFWPHSNVNPSGRKNNADTIEISSEWSHLLGTGAVNPPFNVAGVDFRDGRGTMVRFGGNLRGADVVALKSQSSMIESRRTRVAGRGANVVNQQKHFVLIPVYFVSSALVKVEPPSIKWPEPGGVTVDVTGNGGAGFSTQTLLYVDTS